MLESKRKRGKAAIAQVSDSLQSYGGRLAGDEKLRQRILAAAGAGVAARQRARRQAGLLGAARRLATDPVLRAQIAEAIDQSKKASKRIQRKESHRLRNTTLFLVGAGMVAAALPGVRRWAQDAFGGGADTWSTDGWVAPDAAPSTPVTEGPAA